MADTNERKHDRIVIAETLEAIVALQFDTNAKYLRTLADAATELRKADAELAATPPADAALADALDCCLRNIYDHIQHKAYNDALSSTLEAQKHAAALRARAVPQSAPAGFVEWLCQEMPPGTVISDPAWWAPKIHRAMLAASKEDGK